MRFAASMLCWIALAVSAFGQASTSVQTVNTVAELIARTGSVGELVAVRNYSTNVAWPAPRMFRQYSTSVITNAHDGVHYITNARPSSVYVSFDRYAAEQDASWWGAAGDVVTDDTAALNAAAAYSARYIDESAYTTLKGPGRGFLRIRPTPTGYLITNTVNIRGSVEASGAALVYRGPTNVAYNALLVAPENPTSTFINNHTFNLPDVWGWDRGFDHTNSVGIRVQGIGRSTINFPYVYRFAKAVEFLCDTEAVTLCTFNDGFFDTCKISVSAVLTNNGYFNGNTWFGMRVNNENPNFKPGTTDGHEIIRLESFGGSLNGNTWSGGSWEGFPGQRLVYIHNGSANIFRDMRLEHHVSDYTNVVAGSLYMEVYSDLASVGVDNRIQNPNQGVNGMAGVRVKETGLAIGNMGASSQFAELRTRDNGYNHGPLVFTPSAGSSAQAMLSVYPQFSWPSNHWVNYDQWLMKMTAGGWIYKAQTDAGFRLWLEPSGNVTWATGSSAYEPMATIFGGTYNGYDDAGIRRIQLNRSGALTWYDSTNGNPVGTVRPYLGSTFGGFTISDVPSNQLSGWTHVADLNSGSYAFPGQDWVAGSPTNKWVYVSQGIFGPSHPHGYIQNRAGVFMDGSDSGAWGGSGYVIAMPKSWMDFQVRLGATTSPSLQVDQSTNAGDTRLSTWVVSSNAPVRIRHDNATKIFHTGPSLAPGFAGLSSLGAGSPGQFPTPVGDGTWTWTNAPSGASTNGGTVTSVAIAVPAGLSVTGSPVTGSGTISIGGVLAVSAGGTGITNLSAAAQALLAASSKAAMRAELELGTAAQRDVASSGDAATNQVVLGSDTRLTDARTPVAHNHAAGDITSGTFSTARIGTGTPNGSNFLRGDGSFAQVSTNDIPGLVAALAAGGGGGISSVQVNGVGGASNLVNSATVSMVKTNGDAAPALNGWTAPNKQIAAWTALNNAPGTNASTVAQFAIRGDGIPALVFTNNVALEANFTTWIPSGIDLTSGLNVTVAAYGTGNGGASNMVVQADLMRLCCTGSGALDTNAFTTSGAVTSALPTTVSVPTNLLVALPTLTGIAAGDLVRVRLTRVVGSASDTNDFNLGVIAAKLEAR